MASTCRDCDEPIQWIDGKPYDLAPALHYRSCTSRRKQKQKRVMTTPKPLVQFGSATSLEDQERVMKLIADAERGRIGAS